MQSGLLTKAVILFALTAALPAHAAGRIDQMAKDLARAPHVPGELLVQWVPGTTAAERSAARSRIGGARAELIVRESWRAGRDGAGEIELVHLPPGLAIADAARGIERDSAVDFAEPNWIYEHQETSNDPYYVGGQLWGMYGDDTSPSNASGR